MSNIHTLPLRKALPSSPETYTTITLAERTAADDLLRAATALQRNTLTPFATTASRKRTPGLIEEVERALARLREMGR